MYDKVRNYTKENTSEDRNKFYKEKTHFFNNNLTFMWLNLFKASCHQVIAVLDNQLNIRLMTHLK